MLDLGERRSIYQPEQGDRIFPRELKTNDPKALREHRKEHLAGACRAFAGWGLDYGFAGHLTIRDPEQPELYWTNPMAVHFGQVTVSSLILVNQKGEVVEGDYAVNQAGFVLHAAVHAAHPDILAMCHAHTVYGGAYASLGRPLPPITQDACAFFEDHAVLREEAGQVAVERGAGLNIAPAFKGIRAAIHQNHGLFTVSRHSIDAAAFAFMALERCCQQQLMIEATGRTPIEIPAERARYSREHVGNEYTNWLCFQTVYGDLVERCPDMFD
ncbi:MAG: class II aldolase/adducin family protein [Alphaproteobacteria bacterium]|jgi:ribulose-5-phosphate 4-epimerase/fuculose-1-phosphate aldolase|nr:class II aldolase/adducin family protein [Alphaproteobacteria bacterium]